MDNNVFEARMRKLEYFHNLRLLPGAWAIIRVDGRSFSTLTKDRYEKPFDIRFHKLIVETAQVLLEELQGVYAYTESDEISILLKPEWDMFDRSLEKVISISASIASAAFTYRAEQMVQFDSRVWLGANKEQVLDYFSWRQSDATRCALNAWSYWILRRQGYEATRATSTLDKQTAEFKNELLFKYGVNFNEVPLWQRRGTGLYWESYEKVGYNPITKEEVIVNRRRIKRNEELPMKEAYRLFVEELIS